jgi:4-amino-4-deoxy-L-arabinose transferase-like glycosyltransferase
MSLHKKLLGVFAFLIFVGVLLRVLFLGSLPAGLQQDEASIGYETLSLLKTGADRWGVKWPVYFISWGSGQNTLYAYLSIPFVWLFGNTDFAIRFLSMILGLGAIFLSYKLIFRIYGEQLLALFVAVFFLFEPWHFMQSRWAFEGNIIPFFIILVLLSILRSVQTGRQEELSKKDQRQLLWTFVPIAFLLYCSAITLFIVPFFLVGIVIVFWKDFIRHRHLYLYSFLLFCIAALPFGLFILKNNVLKTELGIEGFLPFSLPFMLDDRAALPSDFQDIKTMFLSNWPFLQNGFDDGRGYNFIHGSVSHFALFMAIPGLLFVTFEKNKFSKTILFWAFASCIVPFMFISNLNRTATLQTAISLLVPIGIYFTIQSLVTFRKYLLAGLIAVIIAFQALTFYKSYFFTFPLYSHEFFEEGLEDAIHEAMKLRGKQEKVGIAGNLLFNYVYTAYYSDFDPATFQKANRKFSNHTQVFDFGPFMMMGKFYYDVVPYPQNIAKLKAEDSFLTVIRTNDTPISINYQTLYSNERWRVLRHKKAPETEALE